MSRDAVACVTTQPAAASASISSNCVPTRLRLTMLSIRRCRSAFASGRPFCITAEYICRFASKYRRTTPSHVAQASLDRAVRRIRRTRDDRLSSQRGEDLANPDGRGASDKQMIAVDEKIDRAADKLRQLAQRAAAEGGFA